MHATACFGGNTLELARIFAHAHAAELDSVRASMLRHNLARLQLDRGVAYTRQTIVNCKALCVKTWYSSTPVGRQAVQATVLVCIVHQVLQRPGRGQWRQRRAAGSNRTGSDEFKQKTRT